MVCPPPCLEPTQPEAVISLGLPCSTSDCNEHQMSEEEAGRTRHANFYNNFNINNILFDNDSSFFTKSELMKVIFLEFWLSILMYFLSAVWLPKSTMLSILLHHDFNSILCSVDNLSFIQSRFDTNWFFCLLEYTVRAKCHNTTPWWLKYKESSL